MLSTFRYLSLVAIALASFNAYAEKLSVYPAEIRLEHARDVQRLVVVHLRDDGVTIDATAVATIAIEPPGLAEWTADSKLVPRADGDGVIRVTYGGMTAEAPLRVTNAASDPAISFRNDVEPVLMRAGCNSGACHGSAQGKNGFRLSLFGYDPAKDYLTLTREQQSRRVNASLPGESLFLMKPTAQVGHEGDARFAKDSAFYQTLRRWIAEGAQDDPSALPSLESIRIEPSEAVLLGAGATQQFVVQATYSDGSDRDVTELAILSSVDDAILSVDEFGLATAGARGEAYVMARFGSFAEIAQTISIPADAPASEFSVAPANYIDELVYEKLRKLRIAPAARCNDETFLRRVYLDVLGVLPTVDEARAFLADESPDKRAGLVEALLQRPEFPDVWAMKWADVLRVRSTDTLDRKGMHRYNDWLRAAISTNKPMDELVRELLTAEGGNFASPASNFYLVEREPTLMAENVAQVFMGVQIKCAQCHNHPFERWTMDDYYSFAAFFSQVGRKSSSDPRETIIYNAGSGEVKNLRDGRQMKPKYLGGAEPDTGGRDRRAVLADWLVAPENPWFAKNIANRVWEHFFGRGIVDPTDDVRVSNPPSNAALLTELGRRLAEQRYDLRKIVFDICTSNTYQLATRPAPGAEHDSRNFAYARVRRLSAEFMLDAINQVSGAHVKFASLPMGARAAQVADGPSGNYFLEIFGRPSRETASTRERRNEPTLAQALHLINGDTMSNAIGAADGRLAQAIANEKPTKEIIEELYLAAYARPPRAEEIERLLNYAEASEDKTAALQDIYWSVLNSKEFVFTH